MSILTTSGAKNDVLQRQGKEQDGSIKSDN